MSITLSQMAWCKIPKNVNISVYINILPHIIIDIKTMKYIANIIRMAANMNKFALFSFEIT
jgi:hypothetical protein